MKNVYITAYIEDWDLFNSKIAPLNNNGIFEDPGEFAKSKAFIRPIGWYKDGSNIRQALLYFRCNGWNFKSEFEITEKENVQPLTFYAKKTPLYERELDELIRELSIRLKCTILCKFEQPNGTVSAFVYHSGEEEENLPMFVEDFETEFNQKYMVQQRDNILSYYDSHFPNWFYSVNNEQIEKVLSEL